MAEVLATPKTTAGQGRAIAEAGRPARPESHTTDLLRPAPRTSPPGRPPRSADHLARPAGLRGTRPIPATSLPPLRSWRRADDLLSVRSGQGAKALLARTRRSRRGAQARHLWSQSPP